MFMLILICGIIVSVFTNITKCVELCSLSPQYKHIHRDSVLAGRKDGRIECDRRLDHRRRIRDDEEVFTPRAIAKFGGAWSRKPTNFGEFVFYRVWIVAHIYGVSVEYWPAGEKAAVRRRSGGEAAGGAGICLDGARAEGVYCFELCLRWQFWS